MKRQNKDNRKRSPQVRQYCFMDKDYAILSRNNGVMKCVAGEIMTISSIQQRANEQWKRD